MDDVITRIVEIERQCSADVEQAEREYGKRIEEHKHALEEKKANQYNQIKSAEHIRLTESINEAKRKTEAASAAFKADNESLFQDPLLIEGIKEDIISILLQSE